MEETVFPEKVKLLLFDSQRQYDQNKPKKSRHFAALGGVWWAFFVASLTFILILLVVMIFSKCETNAKIRQKPLHWTHIDGTSSTESVVDSREFLSLMLETSDNVFFVTTNPLDVRSSCSLESFLIRFSRSKVFLVVFDSRYSDGWYEKKLRSDYSNLVTLKANGRRLFENSLFDGDWIVGDDETNLKKAQLLLLWQYGGTLVWNPVLITGRLPSNDGVSCLISSDVVFCPKQCSAFVYRMILTAKNPDRRDVKSLVDDSIDRFCGGKRGNCRGVEKLGQTCEWPSNNCLFASTDGIDDHNWSAFSHFCPSTYSARQNPNKNSVWFDVVY